MKVIKYIFIVIFLFSICFIYSERKDNIDFIIILDKSLSMYKKISAVKEYINKEKIDNEMQDGDTITVVAFYGGTEKVLAFEEIKGNKEEIKKKISSIKADGKFTDIGNALDSLKNILNNYQNKEGRFKRLLLITDGKQEAPAGSKYYSPDGSINHEFIKDIEETIQKQGWMIHILGIGKNTITKDLSKEFKGSYVEVDENASVEDIINAMKNTTIDMRMIGKPQIDPVPKNGETTLKITIKSIDYNQPAPLTIGIITLKTGDKKQENLIKEHRVFVINPNTENILEIPVKIDLDLKSGKHTGEVSFVTIGGTTFAPALSPVEFVVKGFLSVNFWWLLIILIIVAAVIIYLLYLLSNSLVGSTSFKINVDGVNLNKERIKVKHGRNIYIADSSNGFDILPIRNSSSFARISSFKKGIRLVAIDEDRFENPNNFPYNMLNNSCSVKKQNGTFTRMSFKK